MHRIWGAYISELRKLVQPKSVFVELTVLGNLFCLKMPSAAAECQAPDFPSYFITCLGLGLPNPVTFQQNSEFTIKDSCYVVESLRDSVSGDYLSDSIAVVRDRLHSPSSLEIPFIGK